MGTVDSIQANNLDGAGGDELVTTRGINVNVFNFHNGTTRTATMSAPSPPSGSPTLTASRATKSSPPASLTVISCVVNDGAHSLKMYKVGSYSALQTADLDGGPGVELIATRPGM